MASLALFVNINVRPKRFIK